MSNKIQLGVVVGVCILVVLIFAGWKYNSNNNEIDITPTPLEELIPEYVSLTIKTDPKDMDAQTQKILFVENETVYDMLRRVDKEDSKISFTFEEFNFGDEESSYNIASVNGSVPNSDKEFWAFKVNGKTPGVGISEYMLAQNNEIEFELTSAN